MSEDVRVCACQVCNGTQMRAVKTGAIAEQNFPSVLLIICERCGLVIGSVAEKIDNDPDYLSDLWGSVQSAIQIQLQVMDEKNEQASKGTNIPLL